MQTKGNRLLLARSAMRATMLSCDSIIMATLKKSRKILLLNPPLQSLYIPSAFLITATQTTSTTRTSQKSVKTTIKYFKIVTPIYHQ